MDKGMHPQAKFAYDRPLQFGYTKDVQEVRHTAQAKVMSRLLVVHHAAKATASDCTGSI
jgi:hypothetical protein